MAEIPELKGKRGRIKGSLTKLKSFVDNIPNERKTIEELESRLELLEKHFIEFCAVDDKLVGLSVLSEFSDFEDKYFAVKRILLRELNILKADQNVLGTAVGDLNSTMTRFFDQQRNLLDSVTNQTTSQDRSSLEIRLPHIHIQPFSGDYKDWPSFKDLFVSSVDKREGLSNSHKLQYLKGLLKGEAASLIKHISVTEVNYSEAWSKLVARYDKKHHILNSYIKTFINQPSISHPSAAQLRKITDTSDEIVRGISALGNEAKNRDPWLIYLIINKIDAETRKAWAEANSCKDFPTLQEFFDFLNKRCDALETVEPSFKRTNPSKPTLRTFHSEISVKCPKCSQQHPLFKCPTFKALDVQTRRNLVTKLALCFNCLSSGHQAQRCKSKFSCHICKQPHHSSLHQKDAKPDSQFTSHLSNTETTQEQSSGTASLNASAVPFIHSQPSASTSQAIGNTEIHSLTSFTHRNRLFLLPTALIYVRDMTGTFQLCRILIDSGSQASFITEDCVQRLGLKRERARITVQGLGSVKSGLTRGKLRLTMTSRFDQSQQIRVEAYILPKLTSPQPTTQFNVESWIHLKKYPVADPHFNEPGKIDILLGADHFIEILRPGQLIASENHPALQNTIFGYIVAGCLNLGKEPLTLRAFHANVTDIDITLRKFWEIEEIPIQKPSYTVEEQACESHFFTTHYVEGNSGRYTVCLPFREGSVQLGDSLEMAIRRFNSLERRFKHNSALHEEYCNFIKEYHQLGHLEPVPSVILQSNKEHAYLPHHAIHKPDSSTTKLRVVFDGSARTSNGTSLNKKLMVGPKVQRDLYQILISFRTFRVAITADIEKMYRMVLVDKDDRNFQRIIWREHQSQPLKHLWLNTVTYGTASAPFLATRCLNQLTTDFEGQFPQAEQAVQNNFYVDDLMAGADNADKAFQLQEELVSLLQLRGFRLRKWASNSQTFLDKLSPDDCSISSLRIDEHPTSIKVLGLRWIPVEDVFTFDVNSPQRTPITKRSILSESSRIFDPLGFLAPITVIFKLLLQTLWLKNYSWDEPISAVIESKWNEIRNNLQHITSLRIPRWIGTRITTYELHGFSDASESAYAAVVYCRTTSRTGEVTTTILAAKTKVAPIKQLSVPRLELCGALLLAQLLQSIKDALGRPDISCFGWTDSMVVLSWLSSHPRKWKCYVGNRTSQILTILPRSFWNYVPSKENPADVASRGILPQHIKEEHLWWNGPQWLRMDWTNKSLAEATSKIPMDVDMEERPAHLDSYHTFTVNDTCTDLFRRKSSLRTILRILGRCVRYFKNSLGKYNKHNKISTPWITTDELNTALNICIRWTQRESFEDELRQLQRQKQLSSRSKLLPLTPFVDADQILRVGERLENANCSYNARHPVILPKNHIFVDMLIKYTHEKYLHAGTTLLLSILRQEYWIISCRILIKRLIHHCLKCVRSRAATSQQLMAQLPSSRVSPTRAFENVGVDYAGPISLLLHRGRGSKSTKGYIALFVCLSTKALHLEIASDLSSEAFISCLKRFLARRGIPSNIYSDNATNFVGANRKLCELYKLVISKTHNILIADYLSNNKISWHFIPPAAPHFGGIWESGVKSVKGLLRKTIGDSRLTFEELSTLVAEIEGVLNSRPLGPISDDVSSIDALTPAHFLISQPTTTLPEISLENSNMSHLSLWRLVQKIVQDFWKRWHTDYLTSLQHRPKWRHAVQNLQVGDLVLIRENNLPPSTWPLGRILETHPGQDQLVRVATIRTSKGEMRRPITKLVRLPVC